MEKEIVCTVCPFGCRITVTADDNGITAVSGNTCPRGEAYARQEFVCPMRTLTASVLISGSDEPLLPVRSSKPLPLEKFAACMAELRRVRLSAPMAMHQVVIADILGTGADIIAAAER